MDKPDRYDAKAVELLPCKHSPFGECSFDGKHTFDCPAFYRSAVASALRECAEEARGEGRKQGLQEAAKHISEAGDPEHQALARGIRALKEQP